MVQNIHYSSRLPLQRTQHHDAEALQTLQSGQCILITGPLLITHPPVESYTDTPYLTALLNDIVEWCVSKEIISQPVMVEEWRTLVKENALLRLAYYIEEYLPNKPDFQCCLSDIILQWRTPIPGFSQLFTTYAFRGYITTTYDTFIEDTYYAKWQSQLIKLHPTSLQDACVPSSLMRPFIFNPYGDREAVELANIRQRILRKAMTGEMREQLQQLVADSPILFLGFESADPEIKVFQELFEQRNIFFYPFPLVEEPHLSSIPLAKRSFLYSQLPEEAASANVPSSSLSNTSLLPYIQTGLSLSKPAKTIEIFISYVEHDEKLLEELQDHLTAMQHQYYEQKRYNIKIWHSGELIAGQDWKREIEQRLVKAHIILLLVSIKFLISELCCAIQIQPALERHEAKEAYIIPIILRACDWKHEVFGHLYPLPDHGKPVIKWKPREDAYLNIIMGIRKAIDALFLDTP